MNIMQMSIPQNEINLPWKIWAEKPSVRWIAALQAILNLPTQEKHGTRFSRLHIEHSLEEEHHIGEPHGCAKVVVHVAQAKDHVLAHPPSSQAEFYPTGMRQFES